MVEPGRAGELALCELLSISWDGQHWQHMSADLHIATSTSESSDHGVSQAIWQGGGREGSLVTHEHEDPSLLTSPSHTKLSLFSNMQPVSLSSPGFVHCEV